jgi:hypothetical protein
MLELHGWAPLLAMWIGGVLHLGWLVKRENVNSRRRDETSQRRAA